MGVIKSIFKPRDKPKNHTGDSIGGGRSFPFGRTWSGKSVTERSAMQTTAVYACVRFIFMNTRTAEKSEPLRIRCTDFCTIYPIPK